MTTEPIANMILFKEPGTFASLYAAQRWATENGYSYGSLDRQNPIALVEGEYNLPQKWHNFSREERHSVCGIIRSNDFREGLVEVIIYNTLKP